MSEQPVIGLRLKPGKPSASERAMVDHRWRRSACCLCLPASSRPRTAHRFSASVAKLARAVRWCRWAGRACPREVKALVLGA